MANDSAKTFSLAAPSNRPNLLQEIETLAEQSAQLAGLSEEERDSLAIAVTEVGNNAIIHGNKRDPNKQVYLYIHVQDGEVRVVIRDEGAGFNPEALSNPLDPENLLRESGRGVFIVRSLMDEVSFDFSKGGTEITMIKRKKS
ncbi:ATP-binding protein [candidate division KSB1 bacterium]|nr:ATP-binding protein [candidate division KSB1 bacterium]